MARVKAIVFDSNETLLDLRALDPHFARAFGDAGARERWFRQLGELFFTATITGKYRDFGRLSDSALSMVAEQLGRELEQEQRAAIHEAVLALPAHPDVRPALAALRESKLKLAVLTNSTKATVAAQLAHNALAGAFDHVLSADAVECYKPAREAYAHAARKLGVDRDEIRLVACHAWDVAGALAAGCQAAFVRRPGKALDPAQKPPGIVAGDMGEAAARILEQDA